MKRIVLSFILILVSIWFLLKSNQSLESLPEPSAHRIVTETTISVNTTKVPLVPKIELKVPVAKILDNNYHIFQTFNNCGPVALSMALSYYGINKTQQELGQILRPFQNPQGDNDDKSVTLQELERLSAEFGFETYHRQNGNMQLVEKFIAEGIPVITRTQLKTGEDIGHYRVIKGYDNLKKEIIQDDSLQGHNLKYSYAAFADLWKMFNYEYLVIVPADKKDVAELILADEIDPKIAWQHAAETAKKALSLNADDIYARFNLSIALYYLGDYQASVDEYEAVESKLPFRTLWYQIEPLLAYYKLEEYSKVMTISSKILSNHNRAYSELYILRGDVYKAQGKDDLAKSEYEKAIFYNKNLKITYSNK